ncbi:N-acetylmuramoyl-L-alanine amidase [Flammeovirga sp. EKP202]|uniref:N-acetylmuramoyl-L-alanine amidase n=1 Tax=Flammeovirga sp. EKP202 TaxID=2770592 RepID=UPI00165EC93B|nr:N-acetylmuramoyl-L-alanine amidase [Flammeovirga sp. EKP202]MBD0404701.1 N-acetylmuramoyl-L-alanine amidase [Flammeovirga sp. EKP202]
MLSNRLKYLFLNLVSIFVLFSPTVFGQSESYKQYSFDRKVVIVIDPGHGGTDVGKPRSKSYYKHESDLNLDIAFRLGGYLEERVNNVVVKYTRKTDRTVSLEERVNYANSVKADYFISIHCNSLAHKSYHGTQVHIQSKKFPTSYGWARQIDQDFVRAGRKSRGIKDRNDRGHNLQVIQYTEMPGVLVECGFMSNAKEEAYLNSGKGQTYIASALFRAIRDFENKRPRPAKDNRYPYYRVQIGSTTNPTADLKSKKIRNLKMKVDPHKDGQHYALLVGREYEKKVADKLAKTIQKKGFKDAYVRRFDAPKPKTIPVTPKKEVVSEVKEAKITVVKNDTPKDSITTNKDSDKLSKLHFYRIQIMSSVDDVDLNKREFKSLGYPVFLFYDDESKNAYKYQVLVGKTYSKEEAQKILTSVRQKGFPDAFIVTVLENQARKPQKKLLP